MQRKHLFLFTLLATLTFSCSDKLSTKATDQGIKNMVDEGALDRSVDPCNNFYAFACGGWVKTTEIPAGYSSWYRSFSTIDEDNQKTLNSMLTTYAEKSTSPEISANARKLGDYYSTCMDTESAERASNTVLPVLLGQISSLPSKEAAYKFLAGLHLSGVSGFFNFYSTQDYGDATRVIGEVDRPTLGLPDRDYYLSEAPKKVELRAKYVAHIEKMLALSGVEAKRANEKAAQILEFETGLAKSMLTLAERRDPANLYHLIGKSGLVGTASNFTWQTYLDQLELGGLEILNVTEPKYFAALNTALDALSLDDLKIYLRWQFLHATANTLGKAYVDENFDFYGKTLRGQKAQQERWKKCVQATDALGEALGEAYVGTKFSEESKSVSREMITQIREAVAENFKTIDWMDEPTKTKALEKLNKISPKIGYPDKWRDYSSLVVDRSSYLENSQRADAFESKRVLAKIGKPVDRSEWGMFPHTVNAYYNPSMNEIVFPAAILQAPFFNVKASLGANYGAIGMVMGHEITHGFDDEGRSFDGDGNLKDWWSSSVAEKFEAKADCLVKQYDAYTVSGGVHLNGKLTLGENIADLGGLKLSWAAYKRASEGKVPAPAFNGFTEDQQFYISYAQAWCAKLTPEYEQLQAQTNPHSTPEYRVNGVVVNLPTFQQTFSCQGGAPMAPVQQCSIW